MSVYFLEILLIALYNGALSGELLNLSWILEGVVDLLLTSIGMLGLVDPLGVVRSCPLVLKDCVY